MPSPLAQLLERSAPDLVADATRRLLARPEFAGERGQMVDAVTRQVAALTAAARAGSADDLSAAALSFARADQQQERGYRRAQLVLEALCAGVVELIRQVLPKAAWRDAQQRLRALVGPAQAGLARMFRAEEEPTVVEA
ncbi:MAG: hypothetical protein IT204_02030 [Fimbriimonadaceae bacterium]|nr:hypothetical protein [Fimbriimonadaceae bacterium]